jgi:hypothetical protein
VEAAGVGQRLDMLILADIVRNRAVVHTDKVLAG